MANPTDKRNDPRSPTASPASSPLSTYLSLATRISDVPASVLAVFVRMADCYGNRWTSQFQPDEATTVRTLRTWAHELAGIPEIRISHALSTMLARHPSWPPTLGEFLQLAHGDGDVVRHAREFVQPPLPQPPMSEETCRAIKAMMARTQALLASGRDADDLGGL